MCVLLLIVVVIGYYYYLYRTAIIYHHHHSNKTLKVHAITVLVAAVGCRANRSLALTCHRINLTNKSLSNIAITPESLSGVTIQVAIGSKRLRTRMNTSNSYDMDMEHLAQCMEQLVEMQMRELDNWNGGMMEKDGAGTMDKPLTCPPTHRRRHSGLPLGI